MKIEAFFLTYIQEQSAECYEFKVVVLVVFCILPVRASYLLTTFSIIVCTGGIGVSCIIHLKHVRAREIDFDMFKYCGTILNLYNID